MRYIFIVMLLFVISGCNQIGQSTGTYTLFETSKGVIYRLNTVSGETEIIYSPLDWPKLNAKTIYEGENGKKYDYLGSGKLKELSAEEVADILIEEHAK